MADSYKTSLANALNNYFDLLNGAKKRDDKKQAIIRNVKKKRGEKK